MKPIKIKICMMYNMMSIKTQFFLKQILTKNYLVG